jgi:hypothetical protein
MLPTLATIERVLAICAGDVKIMTWLGVVTLLPLRLERTTPGTARKLTVTESITVDWRVVT